MPKKRKLFELYQLGKELTIDDGKDRETVWLQKLSAVQVETAFRRANAARARVLSAKSDHDSDDYQALWGEVLAMGEDVPTLIEYLLAPKAAQSSLVAEAQLAAEEEWSKNDYLQGLRDAWADGLSDTHVKDPDDPEAKRVLDELQRFADAAQATVDAEVEAQRRDLVDKSLNDLRELALDSVVEFRGNSAWLKEFNHTELWLGVRDAANHDEPYFSSRADIDGLATPVLVQLMGCYDQLKIDVIEGKGSEETPGSSPSSEPSSTGETERSSGLVAVGPS